MSLRNNQTKGGFQGILLNTQFLYHVSEGDPECDYSGESAILNFERSPLSLLIIVINKFPKGRINQHVDQLLNQMLTGT